MKTYGSIPMSASTRYAMVNPQAGPLTWHGYPRQVQSAAEGGQSRAKPLEAKRPIAVERK
jgi:hypothetical protein